MMERNVKKPIKKKKMKYIKDLCTFEKINVSDFKQESISSGSSKEGEI